MKDPYDDMSPEEKRKHIEALRRMTPEQRFSLACEASDRARQEKIALIKADHPEYTHKQVMRELIRRLYGEELYQEVAKAKGWE